MSTNLTTMTTPDLIAKRSPAREKEAARRLSAWTMSPKNVRRLEAYLGAPAKKATRATAKKAAQARAAKPAPAKKPARKGCPIKAICAQWADSQVPNKGEHMSDWWLEYKHATAWFRALEAEKNA